MNFKITVILWHEGEMPSNAGDYFIEKKDRFQEVIFCETNGRAESWNDAVRKSNGDLILFVKADACDLQEDLCEKITDAFSDDKLQLLTGRVLAADRMKRYRSVYQKYRYPEVKTERTIRDLCLYGVQNFLVSNVFAVYRRTVFENTGLFEPDCLITPEILKAAQILYKGGKIVYDPALSMKADASAECFDGFRKAFSMGVAGRYYAQILGMDYEMLFTEDRIDFYPVIQKNMKDYYTDQRKASEADLKGKAFSIQRLHFVEKIMILADMAAKKYHLLPRKLNALFSGNSEFFA